MLDVVNMIQIKTHICKFIFNLFLFILSARRFNKHFIFQNKLKKIENYGKYFMLRA